MNKTLHSVPAKETPHEFKDCVVINNWTIPANIAGPDEYVLLDPVTGKYTVIKKDVLA